MLDLQPHADGVLLNVKAQAGARRNALRGVHDGALRVAVTQVAEKGKANQAIIGLLADTLGVPRSAIEIVSGETTARKKLLIRGMPLEALRRSLQPYVDNGPG
ncbi:MAG: DUF167 domain-containing protein [Pirellulaceae bacterium]|nr:DUF167 domain-containing protein [Pirellulaceae bacterium]